MKKYLILIVAILISGCSVKTQYVEDGKAYGEYNPYLSLGIDSADFEYAASNAVNGLLKSGALNKADGSRYVIAVGNVVNDTTQRIDTDLLTKKIRIELLNSGKAIITTAISENGPEDETTFIVRDQRDNEEFNQSTIAQKGTLHAPDMSLNGKILQRTTLLDKKRQLVDYYFQLTLTDISSGLALWENETKITKTGSAKSVVW
ncbi:MAG: penicillin-binding protein activator LpoB [Campylobacter sp.]|nr:penicillin-binding protein activator LpoB [Campylobacter sp.]